MANPTTTHQKPGFGDKAEDMMGKAKETASTAYDKAKDVASGAADKARDVASQAGKQAENYTQAAGKGMESLAGTIRENMPREGVLGAATSRVAGGLEATGHYLEHEGLSGMANDMTNMIRNNPIPALLFGVGLGFLLARVTSSRS